jgi:hypothetical protein
MKNYTHTTGTKIKGYASHKEHTFYETTTKRQMFLIIEQFATLLKEDSQDWVDKATTELEILKINNIK